MYSIHEADHIQFRYMFTKNKNKFKELSHTADVGIRALGDTLEALFANSLFGMYHILFGDLRCQINKKIKINLKEKDLSDLLVVWLSEINFLLNVKYFITGQISDLRIDSYNGKYRLQATLQGDDSRNYSDSQLTEIKAVTYHQLYIKSDNAGYTAQIYFDL